MSTPDIESLVAESFDQPGETESVEVEPQEEASVEPEQPQEAREEVSGETEENFTKLDPNALSEENKKIYKMLQADYTRKRQSDAEKVKKLETQIEALQKPQNPQGVNPEDDVKRAVREENDRLWDIQAQSDYPELDPRLNENDPLNYDEILDSATRLELTTKLDEYVEAHGTKVGFDYKKVFKEFVGKWDKYIENLNKAYIQKQTQKAKENADKLKKEAPVVKSSNGVKTGKMSIESAVDEAFNEA